MSIKLSLPNESEGCIVSIYNLGYKLSTINCIKISYPYSLSDIIVNISSLYMDFTCGLELISLTQNLGLSPNHIDFLYERLSNNIYNKINYIEYNKQLFVYNDFTFIPKTSINNYPKLYVIIKLISGSFEIINLFVNYIYTYLASISASILVTNILNIILIILLLFLYLSRNINSSFIFFIIFFLLVKGVTGISGANLTEIYKFLASLGLVIYWILISLYDYFCLRRFINNPIIIINRKICIILTGLFFTLTISTGIFSTNSFWLVTNDYDTNNGWLWFAITFLLTVIYSGFWCLLKTINTNNVNSIWSHIFICLLRSFCEVISFNSVCWNTYFFSKFLASFDVPFLNIVLMLIASLFHFISSGIVIYIECLDAISLPTAIFYGFSYYVTWFTTVISTNNILDLLAPYMHGIIRQALITIAGGFVVSFLQPKFYRSKKLSKKQFLFHILINFLLVLSYILKNFLLFRPLT